MIAGLSIIDRPLEAEIMLVRLLTAISVIAAAVTCSQAQGRVAPKGQAHRPSGQPGLRLRKSENKPVPPIAVSLNDVKIVIEQRRAQVTVDQYFRNDSSEKIEADYFFPLPETASLVDFVVYQGKTRMRGPFDEGSGTGAKTELADLVRTGWLFSYLPPLPPHTETRIEIVYSQPLVARNGIVEFLYPLVGGPEDLRQPVDAMRLHLDLKSADPIESAASPTHPMRLEREADGHFTGDIEIPAGSYSGDFRLEYKLKTASSPAPRMFGGQVTDPSGAVVPGATVTIRADDAVTRSVITDVNGNYRIDRPPEGAYSVEVNAPGFKRAEVANAGVSGVRIQLEPATVSETMTVVAIVQAVSTTTAQASSTLGSSKLRDLPNLNSVDSFARLSPGADVTSSGSDLRIAINGGQPRSNSFAVDELDNRGVDGLPVISIGNPDAIDMLHVVNTRGSGDVSQTGASAINLMTRPGTNVFHGSAFDYYLNRSLGALSPLERRSGLQDPPTHLSSVFGMTLAGPIRRDRAFFLGSFQGEREGSTRFVDSTSASLTPTLRGLRQLETAFPDSPTVADLITRGPLADLFARGPLSPLTGTTQLFRTFPGSVAGAQIELGELIRLVPSRARGYEAGGRLDVSLTGRDSLEASYWFDQIRSFNSLGRTAAGHGADSAGRGQLGGFTWNRLLSPLAANRLSTGFNRVSRSLMPFETILGPSVAVGFNQLSYGESPLLPQSHASAATWVSDLLSLSRSRHNIKLGGQFSNRLTDFDFAPGVRGQYSFSSLDDFARNKPAAILVSAGSGESHFTENHHHYFADDAWRAKDNLTVSIGLSYENASQPLNRWSERLRAREGDRATALFDPSLPLDARSIPRVPRDNNNIAPRIGIAYTPRFRLFGRDPFGRDKTVLRAGASISYDSSAYRPLADIAGAAPSRLLAVLTPGSGVTLPSFPGVPDVSALRELVGADPRRYVRIILDQDFRTPSTTRWHLAASREIGERSMVEIGYVGARSARLLRLQDAGPLNGQLSETDQQPGSLLAYSTTGTASYHALQFRSNVRISERIDGGVSYSFSRLIDDVPENAGQGHYVVGSELSLGAPALPLLAQNPLDVSRGERGLSSIDRRHLLNGHFVWSLPPYRGQTGVVGRLLSGWKASAVIGVASGSPLTPIQQLGTSSGTAAVFAALLSDRLGSTRPFNGNPSASADVVAFSNAANAFYRFFSNSDGSTFVSPTGFIIADRSGFRAGSPSEARFIYNDYSVEAAARARGLGPNGLGQTFAAGRRFGDVGRNILTGPGLVNFDFALLKTTKVTEKVSVQLRAEFFNLFNHPNRATPSMILENSGGRGFFDIGETDASPRRFRLGLKVIF